MGTDRPDASLLQHAQQLDLHRRRHFADLVEKDRPAVSGFKEALSVCVRAGKRAFHVTEQLRFEQRFGKCTAVDRDKRLFGTRAQIVDRPGDQFFSGSALAGDQDRRLHLGDGLDHLKDRVHLRRSADDVLDAAAFALGTLEGTVLVDQGLLFKRLSDDEL